MNPYFFTIRKKWGKEKLDFLFCSIIGAVLLSSCASQNYTPQGTVYLNDQDGKTSLFAQNSGYWLVPEGVKGKPRIEINLTQQVARFYMGNTLVGESPVSTGKEGHDTPVGTYSVIERGRHHRSSAYGVFKNKATGEIVDDNAEAMKEPTPKGCVFVGAEMPFFLRFKAGYGMHAGYLPGYAASHGCVRMPDDMAEKFFEHAPLGTPIKIEGSAD